eukprot:CAMPEP_0170558928 /NCGR_PEP_ID=MMETSP0211-20121228/39021_1 /TAXON_ID=311385 /ORGANISM="Pseudokeronopsis sp., Strain OXSARD2" /LENGTH=73 /DNA_ID=CAMNT_0010871401 /DNA_START=1061 /DNA_END=1282 /DNA_ORIENTATION=+
MRVLNDQLVLLLLNEEGFVLYSDLIKLIDFYQYYYLSQVYNANAVMKLKQSTELKRKEELLASSRDHVKVELR